MTFDQTCRSLESFCASLQPGDRVPTHATLMARMGASERTVLRALDELQRAGRVVRRNGVGTFIATRQDGNALPRLLPATGAGTIVVIARPDQSFFDRCLAELHRRAELAGLSLICRPVDSEMSQLLTMPHDRERPCGFVVFHRSLEPLAWRLHQAGCRVVMIGAPHVDDVQRVPTVYGDHELGGYLATSHLLELGHRRLAFLGADDVERTLRWRGHQRALDETGRHDSNIHSSVIRHDLLARWRRDPERAARFFRRSDAPTGIIAWNDHQALQVLGVANRCGLHVPRDLSLVGYDNLTEGEAIYPSLTTIDHALRQQVQAAIALLTRPTAAPSTHTMIAMPTLKVGESSASPTRRTTTGRTITTPRTAP